MKKSTESSLLYTGAKRPLRMFLHTMHDNSKTTIKEE